MIKKIILAGAVALAALGASADKLTFVFGGYPIYSEDLSKVKNITYGASPQTPGAYDRMQLEYTDGSKEDFYIDTDEWMDVVYQPDRGENPVKATLTPHYNCCTLDIDAPEGIYYRVTGMPKSLLEKNEIDPSAWADCLIADDIMYLEDVAASMGITLSWSGEKSVFEYGSDKRNWFPQETPTVPTDYVVVLYTAKLDGDDVVVTSEPLMFEFTTKKLEDLGVEFKMSVEFNSLSMTVKAEAIPEEGKDTSIPFAIDIYTPDQLASYSLPQLVSMSVANYENQVYKMGRTWEDVTYVDKGERTYHNIKPGSAFLAIAYGLEYGAVNNKQTELVIEVPEPEITDNCTFEMTATKATPTSFDVTIDPSNPETRYVAFLTHASKINDKNTARNYVDNRIYWFNETNQINWETSPFVHTGKAENLNTLTDIVDGMHLVAEEKYYVLVCGIAEDGGRNTEVQTIEVCPQPEQIEKELTFKVEFSNLKATQWDTEFDFKVIPSDPDETYVYTWLRTSNPSAKFEDKTDEEFIANHVNANGAYLKLSSGEVSSTHMMWNEYNSSIQQNCAPDYYLFVYGYNGAPTTPLYVFKFTGMDGNIEQVRGPEGALVLPDAEVPTEPLTFDVQFTDWSDEDSYYHMLTCKVTPSDNVNKYVFQELDGDAIDPEDVSPEDFLEDYIASAKALITAPQERSMRLQFTQNTEGAFTTYDNKYVLIFGYDGKKATTGPTLYFINGTTGEVTPIYE